MNRPFRFLILLVFAASGCGRNDVQSYRVPKEEPAQPAMPAGHPDIAVRPPPLSWKTPASWTEMPASNFRVASFMITGADGAQADVSVIPLPGAAGGDFSNVNRWRDQVGQPPVSEDELKKLAESVEMAGRPAQLYDQTGETNRILAVIQHRDGTAWFIKMTGANQVVGQQKPVFVEFLKSVQFAAGSAALPQSPATGGALPPGHPDISATPPAGAMAMANAERPVWAAPDGWKEVPAGHFLTAKFAVGSEGKAQAAVNISTSPGDGGGLAANVNRWRKQLGLSELTADELAKSVTTVNDRISVVEMSGERAALVAAIVTLPERTWFYKLMGDPQIVTAQKAVFTKFVEDVKY